MRRFAIALVLFISATFLQAEQAAKNTAPAPAAAAHWQYDSVSLFNWSAGQIAVAEKAGHQEELKATHLTSAGTLLKQRDEKGWN